MLLINGILNVRHGQNSGSSTGLNRRLHIRIEMIHAGLDSIIPKLKKFHDDKLEREIKTYQEVYDEDVKEQQYRLQNDALKSLGDIPEIFSSLTSQMKGTAAEPHFMSILQHFTLIEGQPEQRAKHYKLINQLVTAITMDGQMGTDKDFSAQTGVTVRTMFSRFETEASLDTALSEIDELEKKLARSERHREELKSELAQADGGLVGELKAQLKQTEERLRVSRNNATSLEEDHETMRQEAIASADDLRLDVYELIEMLIETDKLNNVIDKTGRYRKNRRILLKKYEEQQERAETIQLLEGKSRSKRTSSIQLQNFDDIGDDDDISDGSQEVVVRKADKVKVGSARRKTTFGLPSPPIRTGSERLSGSQFVDADDDNVKAHIEARLMSEDPVSRAS
jgi:cytokinesis protein